MIRILLGSSYFDDWTNEETFVTQDPLGNPVDKRHPWNKVTLPKPQKRDFQDKYSWVASPRIYDQRNDSYVACDTGGGRSPARGSRRRPAWSTSATRRPRARHQDDPAPDRLKPEMELEWKIPEKSNAIERDRARTYHEAYSALIAPQPGARADGGPRRPDEVVERLQGPDESFSRVLQAARGVLSPHGDPGRQGRNYQPYPPTPWNSNPRIAMGLRGPMRMRCRTRPSSRRTARRISRAWTSCGRCGASIRACRAASTCTTARAARCER